MWNFVCRNVLGRTEILQERKSECHVHVGGDQAGEKETGWTPGSGMWEVVMSNHRFDTGKRWRSQRMMHIGKEIVTPRDMKALAHELEMKIG